MSSIDNEPQTGQLLSGGNAPYVEDLYAVYQRDPEAVSAAWRKQGAVSRLVQTMSNRGHLIANIDPLG
jgi:2-oxoglutarate dehydrogenase complex dehydrogenase (E1) component-like enzyme